MNRPLFLSACALAAGATAWALHPQNAGPQQFEIKFKLPAPKPLSPEEALKTFKVQPGFRVELFAAEPMIECPIAMSWDEQGRMYVVEMRGYMHTVDGQGEDQPNGVISILEDTDGDGKADKRTLFADGLVLPRAVMAVDGGALVGEPPNLWFMKDTNGDGKADVKEVVDANFGSRTGQPEHMANSPTRFLDNWVYVANHTSRYKLKDGKWLSEAVPSRGQWGMCQDNYGRPFYNFNSDFLRANFVPESLYKRNPNWLGGAGTGVQVVKDQATWPIVPTPGVNRGYEKNALTDDGRLRASTATCGAAVYRGGLTAFGNDVFVPEPAGNLVKRFTLTEKDGAITGANTLNKGEEFLASTDERFRPVTAYTGPDGALYLADMYRGIIQHKGFLTHYLIANIKDRNLEKPINMGRIWRIVPEGAKATAPKLPAGGAELAAFLGHANGAVRDQAQRILVEKKDMAAVPAVTELVKTGAPLAKIHALWTLEGLGALTPDVVTLALNDADAKVRATGVRLADRSLVPALTKLVSDPSNDVKIALGFTLSSFPEAQEAVLTLARQSGSNALVRDAIISGLRGRELEMIEALLANGSPAPEMVAALAGAVMQERRAARVEKLVRLIAAQPANDRVQIALLEGASGKNAPKGTPKYKLLYLNSEVPELAKIAGTVDAKAKPLFAGLDARIAWPNKPGVPPPPVVKPLTAEEQQLFEKGKLVYTTLCAACHQPNGQGMDGLAPTLVDSDWVLGEAGVLPRIIIHGLTGPIKVNGQSWSLEMPPLGAALSDEQVAAVVTYIRREWEHTASPVSVAEVQRIRQEHKDRTKAWTAEELGIGTKKQAKK